MLARTYALPALTKRGRELEQAWQAGAGKRRTEAGESMTNRLDEESRFAPAGS